MSDPLTHPGQLCASGDRAVDLALELGQARPRLARYEAQEARIRALADRHQRIAALQSDPERLVMVPAITVTEDILAALDEPEVTT